MPGADPAALERLLAAREVEDFLYREAELLDERRWDEWLELLADDVAYWMPLRRNVSSSDPSREESRPGTDMSWFEEGKATLRQRVEQLKTGFHWAEEPFSRYCHVVSGVRVVEASGLEVQVRSRFVVYRDRADAAPELLVGRREDVIRREEGRLRLARRKIALETDVMRVRNITTFL